MEQMTPQQMRIKQANELFNEFSPAQRRSWIALDILRMLKAKELIPTPGRFLGADVFSEVKPEDHLMLNVQKGETCRVCQIGALFVSAVSSFDRCTGRDMGYYTGHTFTKPPFNKMCTEIEKYFSREQMVLIEAAFEYGCGGLNDPDVLGLWDAANFFSVVSPNGAEYQSIGGYDRMRLINENIIMGAGTFDPKRKFTVTRKDGVVTGFVTPGFNQKWLDED